MSPRKAIILPEYMRETYTTLHVFRVEKRMLAREIEDLTTEFAFGSAFLPPDAYVAMKRLRDDIRLLRSQINQKNWGK